MAVLEFDADTHYPVLLPLHRQSLFILRGDETVVEVTDESTPMTTDTWTQMQRVVWAARLRVVADQIEEGKNRG